MSEQNAWTQLQEKNARLSVAVSNMVDDAMTPRAIKAFLAKWGHSEEIVDLAAQAAKWLWENNNGR